MFLLGKQHWLFRKGKFMTDWGLNNLESWPIKIFIFIHFGNCRGEKQRNKGENWDWDEREFLRRGNQIILHLKGKRGISSSSSSSSLVHSKNWSFFHSEEHVRGLSFAFRSVRHQKMNFIFSAVSELRYFFRCIPPSSSLLHKSGQKVLHTSHQKDDGKRYDARIFTARGRKKAIWVMY